MVENVVSILNPWALGPSRLFSFHHCKINIYKEKIKGTEEILQFQPKLLQ